MADGVAFPSSVVASVAPVSSAAFVDVTGGVVASGSPVERSCTGGCVPGGLVTTSTTKGVTVVAGTGVVVALGPNIFERSTVVGLMVVNLNTDGF